MTTTFTQAGTLYASLAERKLRGLLLPYDEVSRPSNVGPVYFSRGTVSIPTDPSIVMGNIRHNREDPVAPCTALEDTPAGIVAEFTVAKTAEGDALLAGHVDGKLAKLSAEIKGLVVDGTRAVSGALFGAGFVDEGAFKSATLYAELADVNAKSSYSSEFTDENGVTWRRVETSETTTEPTENGETTTTVTTVTTEEEAPAEEVEEKEENVPNATVPATGEFGAGSGTTVLGKTGLFEAIINARNTGDRSLVEQIDTSRTGLFALNDVKISGANTVGVNTVQPAYVGELWAGRRYTRKVIPLLSQGPLTSLTGKGYRWGVKPTVAAWTGNKADIPSNTPTTTPYDWTAQRFAGGHDIAREFVDFGQTDVLEAYTRHMVDSYAQVSDDYVLTQLIAAAGAGTQAEVYPTVGGKQVSDAVGKIIQGALQVQANNATPTFALVAPDVYKLLAYTPKDSVSEFLNQALNLEDAEAQVGFRVVSHVGLAAGNVIVGDKQAATVLELGGAPIRVSALDIVKGGVDEALFGYVALQTDLPQALARIINRV